MIWLYMGTVFVAGCLWLVAWLVAHIPTTR